MPVGPVTSSGMGVGASAETLRRSSRIARLEPQKKRPVRGGTSRSARIRRSAATMPAPLDSSSGVA